LKTRINSRLKNNKGFTLSETLIAVAIVVILLGVAFIGIQGLVDRINQTKLDNIAQSIYVSAQNRIRELKSSGEIGRLLTATELEDVAGKPSDWEEDPADTVDYNDLKYFYHNKDNSLSSTTVDFVDFIFPEGSIDTSVLGDNWVVELDPVTGYIYSVFYSETKSADDFYINNTATLDTSGTDSIRLKDFRHNLKGNEKIGYYGGKANMPSDANGNIIQASINVINADILKTRMTAVIPSISDTSVLEFKLAVKGKTSKKTVILKPAVSVENVGTTREFSATVILDKLEAGQNFKDTFGAATWQPAYVESRTGALIPGEDLELSFTVTSNDDSVLDVGPIVRTVNSLFESLNPAVPGEVNIAYGRHLQNLDRSISGLPATAVTSAKQISDIDFNDGSDNIPEVKDKYLWKTLYADKKFIPINNTNLSKYSGYIDASEPDSFKILNMHIAGGIESAGLFGSFSGNEISGVTMVNEKIDGGTNVGGLVGKTASDLTIKDCRLYIEKEYFAIGSTYINNILFYGASNVGGLVGSSTAGNITIKDSFAATIIEGTGLIGGLIGSKTSGNAQIQDSYADSYLIGGASASKIGGLAGGLTAGSSISGSYSAGFGIMRSGLTGNKIASAAGFVPNGISSITNSYSVLDFSELNATSIYTTAPSASTVKKVYYFESGEINLSGSQEYNFTSNAEAAAAFTGSKFSGDDNKNDTYPYNQKSGLYLVTYPYVSITGLPHYGDWLMPEEPEFGKAGLLYWEYVTGSSTSGYRVYMVGRKREAGKYEAVYHDTTSTAHDDGGVVREYGYGYYVAKKVGSNETYSLGKAWSNVNVPANRNTSAESSFNNNPDYRKYVFTCYTTCNGSNPATSYNADTSNYMFMTSNVQNASVTLTPEGEPALSYSFCPFFAKSIKLTGWDSLTWDYSFARPLLQNDPGTGDNKYKIRSLDQLQFINWNSGFKNCKQPVLKTNCTNFPYLHATKKESLINFVRLYDWTYNGLVTNDGPEDWDDFKQLRENQNFVQDYDIECIGRTGYFPIAALGNTTGARYLSFRLPLFAWFGGSYDGQSYKIKNLSITSDCFSVGVFGVTVSSTIRNVVLIRDSQDTVPVIKRPAGSPRGFYAIGTLVGIANEYSKGKHLPSAVYPNYSSSVYTGIIENCAVAGYEVVDESTNPVTPGETAIGGLVGILRTNIDRCSAVNTIKINTRNDRGAASQGTFDGYGDYISVGGIAGRNQTFINNCYSGGEVIVNPSLTRPKIYISGIATSAVTPRFVNTSNSDARLFRSPRYNNCYSYMKLPEPTSNITVGTIASCANFKLTYGELLYYIGGEISNCYHYKNYYETGQELRPVEMVLSQNIWTGQSVEKTYDAMSQTQFCTDLNGTSSAPPYQKVTSSNYSFPCGDVTLEGKSYPFAAVITQEYKNNPSDPDGKKYVHYGEWPGTGKLILKHHDGTSAYTDNSYLYRNGDSGIDPTHISQETGKLCSVLNSEMVAKGSNLNSTSIFEGWYVNVGGVRKKLLNPDGSIFTGEGDIAGYTRNGKFNVNPVVDIELFAMWRISYNPLTFVTASEPPVNTTGTRKYLVLARYPRTGGADPEYYCMSGISPFSKNSPVIAEKVGPPIELQNGEYYLAWPVIDNETMLWEVANAKRNFKFFNASSDSYLKPRTNQDPNAYLDSLDNKSVEKTEYDSVKHNLHFNNERIVLNGTQTGFMFDHISGSNPEPDGGIWLFECDTAVIKETLHEFR